MRMKYDKKSAVGQEGLHSVTLAVQHLTLGTCLYLMRQGGADVGNYENEFFLLATDSPQMLLTSDLKCDRRERRLPCPDVTHGKRDIGNRVTLTE